MNKFFTKTLALVVLSASTMQVHSLTENEATGYSVASGLVVGAVAGAMTYGSISTRNLHNNAALEQSLVALGVGTIVGGITGGLMYWNLYQFTPKVRIYYASRIISAVGQNKLASKNTFANDEELYSYATAKFHVRWPIAQAHELSIALLKDLNHATVLLSLATADTQNPLELSEIEKLNSKIELMVTTLEKNATSLQAHSRYEIQAVLLEGHRREERMEAQAEARHREAMRQQAALHSAAMSQQQALHGYRF